MNILIVGGGGREHTIVWKLSQSPKINKIFCAPGNAGIAAHAKCLDIKPEDINGLLKAACDNSIDLTIVGPELPLSLGIVNLFEKNNCPIIGPSKEATCIESSKVFAKYIMDKYHIPTAGYQVFTEYDEAVVYLQRQSFPLVIKVDGLAGGKGVLIVHDLSQAKKALSDIIKDNKFGQAGKQVIVEEFLEGDEVSMLVFTDGKNFLPMISSQDHKKISDGDVGPNTGGMGAYSPVPFFDDITKEWVLKNIFKPVIKGMEQEGKKFKGVLYAGLVLTEKGPKVLEFNARFGDPETQVILPALETDLMELFCAIQEECLDKIEIKWKKQYSVCVVLASGGYPEKYEKGKTIVGLEELQKRQNLMVFHAGTEKAGNNFITSGGRVLGVTAWAQTLPEAINDVYAGLNKIHFDGLQYRKDIGKKGLKLLQGNNRF